VPLFRLIETVRVDDHPDGLGVLLRSTLQFLAGLLLPGLVLAGRHPDAAIHA
jgi:hypothetical protein